MEIREDLIFSLKLIIKSLSVDGIEPEVTIPNDLSKGDFSSNIALKLGGKLGSPMETGEKIIEKIREEKELYSKFAKIELVNPGFINFHLSHELVTEAVSSAIKGFKPKEQEYSLILEFGDLNPFKEPHIGHLRNFSLGESLARLFEYQGVKVIRANYEGDVGLHVARAVWGIKNSGENKLKEGGLSEKVKFLAESYAKGAKAYEEDENAKKEIDQINIQIYQNDPKVIDLWKEGRQVSLDYFEELYKKLGVSYDKYYFESEMAESAKKIVEENTGKIFEEDGGAVIFRGEKHGLHTRVFITKNGNPMYEAKDLALAFSKDNDFPEIDNSVIMTANEQTEYFKVLLKALEEINKEIAGKTSHLSYGFVNLKEGKMSSRTGDVVGANWLLDETRKRLKEGHKEVSDDVLELISIASVKWSMLRFSRESDISFSIDESIDLAGNSGPYMQYTYARISSLLVKSGKYDFEAISVKNLEAELLALGRLICQFESDIKNATDHFSPNILTDYLFNLAQKYNSFYEKEKIIGGEKEEEKLAISLAVKNVIGQGLELLGISAPEKI